MKKIDIIGKLKEMTAPKADDAPDAPSPHRSRARYNNYTMPPRDWFFTFMCMNIPIAGWIYLFRLAFGTKENQLRDFAKAYLLYKLVFLIITLILLGILIFVGINIADKLLAYMEML